MRPLDLATLVYVGSGFAVLTFTQSPTVWPVLAATHVAGAGLILWLSWGSCRTSTALLREWYPLLLVPLFYAEIPLLNEYFLSTARDDAIRWLETSLFPFEPSRAFAAAAPWRPLSEALHFAYLSYYLIIYGPLILLYFQGRRDAFRETTLAIVMTYYCSYLIYMVFPVRGPWDLFPPSEVPPDGPLRRLAVQILAAGSSAGAAFPSSHQAVAVAQTVCALRHLRRLAPVIGLLSAGIAAGAVYASFHYAVDMIAGAALGVAVPVVTGRLYGRRAGAPPPGAAGSRTHGGGSPGV